VSQNGAALNVV